MRAFARLALLALLTALATSRLTLAYHEVLGHGGGAVLSGGHVDAIELYLVAGGTVRYTLPDPASVPAQVATALGGIVLELIFGVLALLGVRRLAPASRWRFPLLGFATIVILHALYYLGAGVWHGYGDGWWIARKLGAARAWIAWPAGALALLACGPLATSLARACAPWCPGATVRRRVLALGGAALLAGGAHLALAVTEVQCYPRETYRETMKSQVERDVDAALAAMIEDARRRGLAPPPPESIVRERTRVREAERKFPFDLLLALGISLISVAGLTSGLRESPSSTAPPRVPSAVLRAAAGACVGAIGLIAVLRLIF